MSSPSRRTIPDRVILHSDLLRPHGPRVNVCAIDGTPLGWLDRPLAEWLEAALEQRARGGA